MKPFTIRLVLFWISIALCTGGCSEQVCSSITDPQLTISFAQFTNTARTTEQNISVAFTRVAGVGMLQETSLVNTTEAVARIRLPLSHNTDTTTFVLDRTDGRTDTLTLAYTRQPFFISQACGFEMRYNNLTIVSHTFGNQNIVVLIPAVTAAVNEVHVKIYY